MRWAWSAWKPIVNNLINNVEDIVVFLGLNVFNCDISHLLLCSKNIRVTWVIKNSQLKIICFENDTHWYLIHTWSDKAFKGTVVESDIVIFAWRVNIKLTLTVPLNDFVFNHPLKTNVISLNGYAFNPGNIDCNRKWVK